MPTPIAPEADVLTVKTGGQILLQDDVLLARAKADHEARVRRTPYLCPLPDELDPPLKMSA